MEINWTDIDPAYSLSEVKNWFAVQAEKGFSEYAVSTLAEKFHWSENRLLAFLKAYNIPVENGMFTLY